MSKNERIINIYRTASFLDSKTKELRKDSLIYYGSFLVTIFILLVVFLCFVLDVFHLFDVQSYFRKYVFLCIEFVFVLIFISNERRIATRIKERHNFALNICMELSDDIDWKILRKRQIYKSLDDTLQKPIDNFYHYFCSYLCIYNHGKYIQLLLFLVLLIEIIAIITFFALSL